MAKNEKNIKASEEFIKSVLERNFKQTVQAEQLRAAAERLCDAIPGAKKKAA